MILETLQEIAEKVHIAANHVSHADYPSEPPSDEFLHSFQQLSIELQHRYLKLEVQDLLYRVYFSRAVNVALQDNLPFINDRVQGSDLQFIERLKQSNAGKGYYDPGWQILRQELDGMFVVQKNGLSLHIPPERRCSQDSKVGDVISILLPNSRIEDHYYVAISNVGGVEESVIEFFFNLKAEGANLLIAEITQQLECPFTLKVAFDPDDYQRCDSCILSVAQSDFQMAWDVVRFFHRLHSELFLEAVPFLTKSLLPGVAIAQSDGSFGLTCCEMIAEILLKSQLQSSLADGSPLLHQNAELPSKLYVGLVSQLQW